jgi:hypothetical protein
MKMNVFLTPPSIKKFSQFPPDGYIDLETLLPISVFHDESTGKTSRLISHTVKESESKNVNSIKINGFFIPELKKCFISHRLEIFTWK